MEPEGINYLVETPKPLFPYRNFERYNHPPKCDHKFAETEKGPSGRPGICRPQETKLNGKVPTNRP
jgi:hypothetical protein